MGSARFYHLTRSSLEQSLQQLLPRAIGAGLRVELRGTDAARLEWLDQALWLGDEAGFLPHGLAGGSHDALQPVLLTTSQAVSGGTDCLFAVHGAPVEAPEVAALDRVLFLFDGNDPDALGHARGQWKALTAAGAAAEYWSQESGSWQKKADTASGKA